MRWDHASYQRALPLILLCSFICHALVLSCFFSRTYAYWSPNPPRNLAVSMGFGFVVCYFPVIRRMLNHSFFYSIHIALDLNLPAANVCIHLRNGLFKFCVNLKLKNNQNISKAVKVNTGADTRVLFEINTRQHLQSGLNLGLPPFFPFAAAFRLPAFDLGPVDKPP